MTWILEAAVHKPIAKKETVAFLKICYNFLEKKNIIINTFPSPFGATAPIWALAYLHETLRFTSAY
jgi:hypothetical protein